MNILWLIIKIKWDSFKLKIPILGKVSRMVIVSHFTRTFGMLTSVGISPIRALDVASNVANNHKMTEISKQLQSVIEKGHSINALFDRLQHFQINVCSMRNKVNRLEELFMRIVEKKKSR